MNHLTEILAAIATAIDAGTAKIIAVGGVIGVGAGIARGVIEQKYGSLRGWAAGMAAAILFGVLTHLALHSVDMHETLKLVITIAVAAVADDAWRGLRAIGAMVGNDPLAAVRRVLSALRGGQADSEK